MREQFKDEPDDEISSTFYELCHCKKHWIELFRENTHMTNGLIFVQIDEEKGAFSSALLLSSIFVSVGVIICELWNYARANEEPFDDETYHHAIDVKCK